MSSMNPVSRPGHEQRAASNETSVDCGEPTMAWVRHIFAARPVESCSLRNGEVQDFVLKWKITGNFLTGSVRRIA
ncbi:hypothetical protein [Sphingopyxis granuli]|uniref:hypothetical protein n=1 Tax=Sphingopyxis granuli TaxID=267128 RepID=UPI001A9F42E0|nr:hypothetical protein [Sphingopyxis granuli]